MQRQMPVLTQPLSLNPLKDMAKVDEVNDFKTGKVPYNTLRYIPGLAKVGYQGQLHSTETKGKYADDTYKNKKLSYSTFN